MVKYSEVAREMICRKVGQEQTHFLAFEADLDRSEYLRCFTHTLNPDQRSAISTFSRGLSKINMKPGADQTLNMATISTSVLKLWC